MDDRTCKFPGCEGVSKALGLCYSHYRQQKLGKPLTAIGELRARQSDSLEQRLDRYTRKSDGCWIWIGAHEGHGYGKLRWQGKSVRVYKLIWELANGKVPRGMVIDHMCRNTACVRIDHLQVVTHKQNGENVGLSKANTSGARGVTWSKVHGRWIGQVVHCGRRYYVGLFDTVAEADVAVRAKRNELFTNNLADLVHAQRMTP